MADQKISALTAITTLTDDDLIPVVNDPAGTPVTNKITVGSVKTVLTPVDGWIPVTGTWTYASATTITIPSDGTTVYQKGIKIRLKQGGGYKYYVGKTIASTLLTVITNTDYTVANAAITDVSYSYAENPYGFPASFAFTPSFTNFTLGNGTVTLSTYSIEGDMCHVRQKFTLGNTSSVGAMRSNTPVGNIVNAQASESLGLLQMLDASSGNGYAGVIDTWTAADVILRACTVSGSLIILPAISATVPFTWTTSDTITLQYDFQWK